MAADFLIPGWVKFAVGAAVLAAICFVSYEHGKSVEKASWELAEANAKAQTASKSLELAQQAIEEGVKREKTNAAVSSRLLAAIDGVRNRPERPAEVSSAPRPTCEGANGPELARSNAELLARYAAAAARQDAALEQCYTVLDNFRRATRQP